jgi:hypothetical protein
MMQARRNFAPSTREEYVSVARPATTPQWAIDFTVSVLEDSKFDGIVYLIWKSSPSHAQSGGLTRSYVDVPHQILRLVPEIEIRAGFDFVDQIYALLHEIAHVLRPHPIRGHNKEWATEAWRLYRTYATNDFGHMALREAFYKPSSLRAPGAPTGRELVEAWHAWPYKEAYKDQRDARIIKMFAEIMNEADQHGTT